MSEQTATVEGLMALVRALTDEVASEAASHPHRSIMGARNAVRAYAKRLAASAAVQAVPTDALQLARSEIERLQSELQQAQEARAFIVRACHEAQDIAAGLQSERADLLAAQARITLLADVNTELSSALLDVARRVEALKRPCGMDPESAQAIRNGEYMSIALAARAALLSPSGADPVQRPSDNLPSGSQA